MLEYEAQRVLCPKRKQHLWGAVTGLQPTPLLPANPQQCLSFSWQFYEIGIWMPLARHALLVAIIPIALYEPFYSFILTCLAQKGFSPCLEGVQTNLFSFSFIHYVTNVYCWMSLSPLAGLTAKYLDRVMNQTDRVLVLMEFIIWQQRQPFWKKLQV